MFTNCFGPVGENARRMRRVSGATPMSAFDPLRTFVESAFGLDAEFRNWRFGYVPNFAGTGEGWFAATAIAPRPAYTAWFTWSGGVNTVGLQRENERHPKVQTDRTLGTTALT